MARREYSEYPRTGCSPLVPHHQPRTVWSDWARRLTGMGAQAANSPFFVSVLRGEGLTDLQAGAIMACTRVRV